MVVGAGEDAEMGKGYTFVARQRRFTFDDEDRERKQK
jgi:hypothetical protein